MVDFAKRMACGIRNRKRFQNPIYFYLGGLDLYPALSYATHTDSLSPDHFTNSISPGFQV